MHIKNHLIKAAVSLLKPHTPNSGEEKRFLILSTTGLGDTLWGTPALRALRESFKASYIGVVTSEVGGALLKHNRNSDELFVITDPLARSLVPLYRKLKAKKITHILHFHTSQRAMLPLAALLGAQAIIGTQGINKGLDCFLTHPIANTPAVHEIQRRLDIVAQVGAQASDPSMQLFLSPEDEQMADTFLRGLHLPPDLPLIALHPGSKDPFKQWPPSHFIALGNQLVQNLGCRILVTGTASEKSLVNEIASQIEGAFAATHLPLLGAAALIKRMRMMISNDTGPMHLAFAQNIPTIGLFTPTDPKLCGPYFALSARLIEKKPTCLPCLRKKCREPFCLLQIGVQEVYDVAWKLFHAHAT